MEAIQRLACLYEVLQTRKYIQGTDLLPTNLINGVRSE